MPGGWLKEELSDSTRGRIDTDGAARKLRSARAAERWTQVEAAEKAGVSVDTVRRAEEGRFSLVSVVRLAEVYGIGLEKLLFGRDG